MEVHLLHFNFIYMGVRDIKLHLHWYLTFILFIIINRTIKLNPEMPGILCLGSIYSNSLSRINISFAENVSFVSVFDGDLQKSKRFLW